MFADPSRDESLIFELLELKHDVADSGSAVWFLQDLASEQDAEGSVVCLRFISVSYVIGLIECGNVIGIWKLDCVMFQPMHQSRILLESVDGAEIWHVF